MPIHQQYTREILDQLNYVATWLPTVRVEPGDVCDMHGYTLSVVSHLNEFGVQFELEDRPVQSDIEYSSAGAVSVRFKASGEPPPTGSILTVSEAGVSLSFAKSEAVLLRMADCSAKRIRSVNNVGKQVLQLHEGSQWPEGYAVVTEVVQAGVSTIIISNGSDAGIDLAAKASVGHGPITLVSLGADLHVKQESKIGAKFVAMPGLTPLARVSGIRKRFLRPDQFRSGIEGEQFSFTSVDYDDYEGS
jgi:hypothetical protein